MKLKPPFQIPKMHKPLQVTLFWADRSWINISDHPAQNSTRILDWKKSMLFLSDIDQWVSTTIPTKTYLAIALSQICATISKWNLDEFIFWGFKSLAILGGHSQINARGSFPEILGRSWCSLCQGLNSRLLPAMFWVLALWASSLTPELAFMPTVFIQSQCSRNTGRRILYSPFSNLEKWSCKTLFLVLNKSLTLSYCFFNSESSGVRQPIWVSSNIILCFCCRICCCIS